MKAKHVRITGEEQIMMQAMIRMEIYSNEQCERMGTKPAFATETLKTLYQKLAGHEWRPD